MREPTWYASAADSDEIIRIVDGIRDVRLWREGLDRDALAQANPWNYPNDLQTKKNMNAAKYALSLADVSPDDIAVDIDGTSWRLIDASGDFAGLATWEQLQASVAAGEEGWIEGHGLDVYVDGNVDEMRLALKAFWTVTP